MTAKNLVPIMEQFNQSIQLALTNQPREQSLGLLHYPRPIDAQ